MDGKERREVLLKRLAAATGPLTGTALARELSVSRQVIVGDIAILRAAGTEVYATPQGYLLPGMQMADVVRGTFACCHGRDRIGEELNIVVDNGGKLLDVIVEHPVYGEIRAQLMLSSRREVAEFLEQLAVCQAEPLYTVTGGIHLHTVEAPSMQVLEKICQELRQAGVLLD
ncbi:MAG TPA: transcription repressor NadR [Patescibacteria group bacterium]|nr:transcription repressor NadR [Patescibacteria group bacterium]